ncbi:MAG TPA: epimerase [Sulfobacillus sp.]|nr:epimerase [Sulfobacillus sp.]
MRLLVSGGAGFIGAHVVFQALHAGHEVTVLDNLSSGCLNNLDKVKEDVRFIKADIRNVDVLHQAVSHIDIVYHLAASVGMQRSIDNPFLDSDINVMGTLNILEASRKHGVAKVVLASSAGILGESHQLPLSENHPKDPTSPYGVSKMAAEAMTLVYNRIYGLPTVALRYFNVYGPLQRFDAYGNVIPIFAQQILKQEPLNIYGDGGQTRDFVYVGDLARATVMAGTMDKALGVYNIGSGTSISINDLVHVMQDVFEGGVPVRYLPVKLGDVRHSLASIDRAITDLNYHVTTSLPDGLRHYRDWLLLQWEKGGTECVS